MDKTQTIEKKFIITLTESEVHKLVERLKYRVTTIPDLTEKIWKQLEVDLGYEVKHFDTY